MSEKPDPVEFYGVYALQNMLHCGSGAIQRELGEPDGILRWGCMDAPIWLADKALGVPCKPIPRMNWYTASEGARYVGVGKNTFKRIMPHRLGCMVSGELSVASKPLWTEEQCYTVRRKIASGEIYVHWSRLTKPKMGAIVAPARHRTADSSSETLLYRKAYPMVAMAAKV